MKDYFGLENAEVLPVEEGEVMSLTESRLTLESLDLETDAVEKDIEQMENIQDGLDAVSEQLNNTEEMTPELATMAQIATENAMRSLGELSTRIFVGLENVDTFKDTTIANEAIGDVIDRIKESLKKAGSKLMEGIKSIFTTIKKAIPGMRKELKDAEKEVDAIDESKEGEIGNESSQGAFPVRSEVVNALFFNGSMNPHDIADGVESLTSLVKYVNNDYLKHVEKLLTDINAIIDPIMKDVEGKMKDDADLTESAEEIKALITEADNKVLEKLEDLNGFNLSDDDAPIKLPGGNVADFVRGVIYFDGTKVPLKGSPEITHPNKAQLKRLVEVGGKLIDALDSRISENIIFSENLMRALDHKEIQRRRTVLSTLLLGGVRMGTLGTVYLAFTGAVGLVGTLGLMAGIAALGAGSKAANAKNKKHNDTAWEVDCVMEGIKYVKSSVVNLNQLGFTTYASLIEYINDATAYHGEK